MLREVRYQYQLKKPSYLYVASRSVQDDTQYQLKGLSGYKERLHEGDPCLRRTVVIGQSIYVSAK
jgi:hypothetical protein